MLILAHPSAGDECLIATGPAREAVVSWNTRELEGTLELRVNAHDGRTSAWLPYATFSADRRTSCNGRDTFVRLDTDVLRSEVDIVSIGVRSTAALDALYVSVPDYGAPSPIVALPAIRLDVPPVSQYEPAYPAERGWCAPAALAALLGFRSYPVDVPVVAREVFDASYGGTGNWAFNVAFAGLLGFRAAVLHLRDLAHAHAFLVDDIPLAVSIAWKEGQLSGAPLPQSSGHFVVLRGIDANGDALVHDPARPEIAVTYPRAQFEQAWIGHGGIALAVAPAPYGDALVRLANA